MLEVGISSVDIAPPLGINLVGFAGREPSSIGVHDRLKAISLVFSDGETMAALVSCDLLHVDVALVEMVRKEASKRTSSPKKQIAIACTHTHYGPAVGGLGGAFGAGEDAVAYGAILKFHLAGAIQEAFTSIRGREVVEDRRC